MLSKPVILFLVHRSGNWNDHVLSVAIIGNYMYDEPTPTALGRFELLLEYLMMSANLTKDFALYAACQLDNQTASPGVNLLKAINESSYPNMVKHRVSTTGIDRTLQLPTVG